MLNELKYYSELLKFVLVIGVTSTLFMYSEFIAYELLNDFAMGSILFTWLGIILLNVGVSNSILIIEDSLIKKLTILFNLILSIIIGSSLA